MTRGKQQPLAQLLNALREAATFERFEGVGHVTVDDGVSFEQLRKDIRTGSQWRRVSGADYVRIATRVYRETQLLPLIDELIRREAARAAWRTQYKPQRAKQWQARRKGQS